MTTVVSASTVADGGVGTLVSNGSMLQLDGAGITVPLNAPANTPHPQRQRHRRPCALYNLSGINTWSGKVTLSTASSSNATINVNAATQLTVTGTVQDPSPAPIPPASVAPANLTKIGAGTLVFPSANTYAGNTFINQGVLDIRDAASLGTNVSTQQTVNVSGTNIPPNVSNFALFFTGSPPRYHGPLNVTINAAGWRPPSTTCWLSPALPGFSTSAVTEHRHPRRFRRIVCGRQHTT